jgi:dienelactone hydrolase
MNVKSLPPCIWIAIGIVSAGMALAALPPVQGPPKFDRAQMEAEMAAYQLKPDQPGTGRFPALKEVDPSLPDHVVYRPADLSKLGRTRLGILAWGNGGCAADGAGARFHLAEIASHGYLVIANGKIQSGPGAPPQPPRPAMPAAPPAAPPGPGPGAAGLPPPQTKAAGLIEAIDWAVKENARQGSPYFQKLDPLQIAVSGWSCGGVQALAVAGDPRIRTVIIHNSGLFERGKTAMAEMDIGKEALQKLHTPVIYIIGGPTDIAYPQAVDDFSRIDQVPVFVASTNVGHGGTFLRDNGGIAAGVAVSWLDWQLRGDKRAARRFVGKDCGLCKDAAWDVDRKQIEARK